MTHTNEACRPAYQRHLGMPSKSDLSVPEREDYIKAVLCLQSLPARHDSKKIPGAKSRFDDFVAVHINLTNQVHGTANFLGWHRVYLWLYENALRDECGYKGYQPYNNWARYASDPANSPIFNGNASSMSGNGEKFTYDGIFVGIGSSIPPDQGGGCVTSGPFKNMSVNLGPIAPGSASLKVPANPQRDGLGHNPRCLRRDVNRYSAAHTAANYTEALITNASDVGTFQNRMQGQGLTNTWGVHIGGHYTIGGDPGGDFFVSPGDPAFYLHHGMIDRVWWIWQNQKLPGRLSEIAGGTSMGGFPGGANKPGTLQDDILYGVLGQTRKLKDALDTMAGPLCYIYI
ncbi:hypothetical protein KVR01_004291 [Diaporthe batatas]|uniref:uncharacterized protein n=1 Tax=Diaporthe batatas TaxID=748121 RepID=UPI001D03D754|nr:uncharacterized protein KVR01_004291 [Diaporthe batatas]KAG8165739.1 hypothetical protein KVR01_004291 [Diaporthe batatas]